MACGFSAVPDISRGSDLHGNSEKSAVFATQIWQMCLVGILEVLQKIHTMRYILAQQSQECSSKKTPDDKIQLEFIWYSILILECRFLDCGAVCC